MAQPVRSDLRYSADHEWLSAQTPARVGVSAVAVDALGEVVFVELPEASAAVETGEPCGELESTKSVSERGGGRIGEEGWQCGASFGTGTASRRSP